MTHLFPSSSFLGGFLVLILSGFLAFGGKGLFPRTALDSCPPALKAGFLCVISSAFTFLRPFVTSEPLLSSLKTAPSPAPAAGAGAEGPDVISNMGGGPGGGGGGGGPPAEGAGAEVFALDLII